ncbi:MAG: hypothetical protein DRO88_12615 [Promethearchaeia archaeon]|nr:MAG: hypothetical protein DRO88_12615 [Candidatus Lokiarchaeia archaeon]
MNDKINKLILELKRDREIINTKIYNTFVNDVGKIYEIYGYGAAKVYLIDKLRDRRKQREARVILNILNRINNMNISRELVGFIIRKINSIKNYRG